MTKSEFRQLFLQALSAAAENAEARLGRPVPRSFMIELHAPAASEQTLSVDRALDEIYLGKDRFYRTIDVAIRRLLPRKSVAFVRVSGHPPAPFSETWDPANSGPFKQVIAERIEDQSAIAD
jgi:hypothetical protein